MNISSENASSEFSFSFLHNLPVPTGTRAIVLVPVPAAPDEGREAALIAIDKLRRSVDTRADTLAAVAAIAARTTARTQDPRSDTPMARSQDSGGPRSQQDRACNILRLKGLIVSRESLR